MSAIHGDLSRLMAIHDALWERFNPGDRVVYLGNYTGYGDDSVACVDEILTFRRMILSQKGVLCSDLSYLKGAQEEMWQKLLQLQFAPDPTNVLLWMLSNGLSSTLYSYGLSPHDGIEACRNGIMGLTKWTAKIRTHVRAHAGHEVFNTQLRRAAHTDEHVETPLLFVHAGLDSSKSLEEQGDRLWWYNGDFSGMETPYSPFQKVVRGYDARHNGIHLNCVTATIDGGCGFGGSLVCAGFAQNGDVFELLDV